jgi:hypothetical protein
MSNSNFGQFVIVQENVGHIPGNPITPPGQVIDQIAYPGDPSLHFGQAVSEFIHNLHNPTTSVDLLLL